jgi:hypothetical protein
MSILANTRKINFIYAAVILLAIAPFILLAAASVARADCVEELRKVALDKKITVPLKNFRCSTGSGQSAAQVRVEFHRFSDLATSLTLSNTSSTLLTKTFGSMKVLENEVSKTYGDLLKQFGQTYEASKEQAEIITTLSLSAEARTTEQMQNAPADAIGPKKVKHLYGVLEGAPDYPAADEIAALRKKTIPANLNYYYSIDSLYCPGRNDIVCKKMDKTPVEMVFWKSVLADDIANFSRNVRAYNSQLMQVRKDLAAAKQDRMSADSLPNYFSLVKYLGSQSWPDDLMIVTGQYQSVGCASSERDLPGLGGWQFQVPIRIPVMDAMVIENTSQQAVSIGSIFGSRSETNALRVAKDTTELSAGAVPVGSPSLTLAPGARLFVPMRVVFLAPAALSDDIRKSQKSSAEARTRLGLGGFFGREDALRIPQLNDYAYGPSISIRGFELNSSRVNFEKAPTRNFVALTVTSETGSCPHLLSQSDGRDEWISHGKILHKAPGRDREYTETATFKGVRTRFRIEEREPEIAYIKDVRLVVTLQDGAELTLRPSVTRAGAPVTYPLHLMWGESVDVDFTLPDGVASEAIVESRFSATGYYERYSSLSLDETSSRSGDLEKQGQGAAVVPINLRADNACFRPEAATQGLAFRSNKARPAAAGSGTR